MVSQHGIKQGDTMALSYTQKETMAKRRKIKRSGAAPSSPMKHSAPNFNMIKLKLPPIKSEKNDTDHGSEDEDDGESKRNNSFVSVKLLRDPQLCHMARYLTEGVVCVAYLSSDGKRVRRVEERGRGRTTSEMSEVISIDSDKETTGTESADLTTACSDRNLFETFNAKVLEENNKLVDKNYVFSSFVTKTNTKVPKQKRIKLKLFTRGLGSFKVVDPFAFDISEKLIRSPRITDDPSSGNVVSTRSRAQNQKQKLKKNKSKLFSKKNKNSIVSRLKKIAPLFKKTKPEKEVISIDKETSDVEKDSPNNDIQDTASGGENTANNVNTKSSQDEILGLEGNIQVKYTAFNTITTPMRTPKTCMKDPFPSSSKKKKYSRVLNKKKPRKSVRASKINRKSIDVPSESYEIIAPNTSPSLFPIEDSEFENFEKSPVTVNRADIFKSTKPHSDLKQDITENIESLKSETVFEVKPRITKVPTIIDLYTYGHDLFVVPSKQELTGTPHRLKKKKKGNKRGKSAAKKRTKTPPGEKTNWKFTEYVFTPEKGLTDSENVSDNAEHCFPTPKSSPKQDTSENDDMVWDFDDYTFVNSPEIGEVEGFTNTEFDDYDNNYDTVGYEDDDAVSNSGLEEMTTNTSDNLTEVGTSDKENISETSLPKISSSKTVDFSSKTSETPVLPSTSKLQTYSNKSSIQEATTSKITLKREDFGYNVVGTLELKSEVDEPLESKASNPSYDKLNKEKVTIEQQVSLCSKNSVSLKQGDTPQRSNVLEEHNYGDKTPEYSKTPDDVFHLNKMSFVCNEAYTVCQSMDEHTMPNSLFRDKQDTSISPHCANILQVIESKKKGNETSKHSTKGKATVSRVIKKKSRQRRTSSMSSDVSGITHPGSPAYSAPHSPYSNISAYSTTIPVCKSRTNISEPVSTTSKLNEDLCIPLRLESGNETSKESGKSVVQITLNVLDSVTTANTSDRVITAKTSTSSIDSTKTMASVQRPVTPHDPVVKTDQSNTVKMDQSKTVNSDQPGKIICTNLQTGVNTVIPSTKAQTQPTISKMLTTGKKSAAHPAKDPKPSTKSLAEIISSISNKQSLSSVSKHASVQPQQQGIDSKLISDPPVVDTAANTSSITSVKGSKRKSRKKKNTTPNDKLELIKVDPSAVAAAVVATTVAATIEPEISAENDIPPPIVDPQEPEQKAKPPRRGRGRGRAKRQPQKYMKKSVVESENVTEPVSTSMFDALAQVASDQLMNLNDDPPSNTVSNENGVTTSLAEPIKTGGTTTPVEENNPSANVQVGPTHLESVSQSTSPLVAFVLEDDGEIKQGVTVDAESETGQTAVAKMNTGQPVKYPGHSNTMPIDYTQQPMVYNNHQGYPQFYNVPGGFNMQVPSGPNAKYRMGLPTLPTQPPVSSRKMNKKRKMEIAAEVSAKLSTNPLSNYSHPSQAHGIRELLLKQTNMNKFHHPSGINLNTYPPMTTIQMAHSVTNSLLQGANSKSSIHATHGLSSSNSPASIYSSASLTQPPPHIRPPPLVPISEINRSSTESDRNKNMHNYPANTHLSNNPITTLNQQLMHQVENDRTRLIPTTNNGMHPVPPVHPSMHNAQPYSFPPLYPLPFPPHMLSAEHSGVQISRYPATSLPSAPNCQSLPTHASVKYIPNPMFHQSNVQFPILPPTMPLKQTLPPPQHNIPVPPTNISQVNGISTNEAQVVNRDNNNSMPVRNSGELKVKQPRKRRKNKEKGKVLLDSENQISKSDPNPNEGAISSSSAHTKELQGETFTSDSNSNIVTAVTAEAAVTALHNIPSVLQSESNNESGSKTFQSVFESQVITTDTNSENLDAKVSDSVEHETYKKRDVVEEHGSVKTMHGSPVQHQDVENIPEESAKLDLIDLTDSQDDEGEAVLMKELPQGSASASDQNRIDTGYIDNCPELHINEPCSQEPKTTRYSSQVEFDSGMPLVITDVCSLNTSTEEEIGVVLAIKEHRPKGRKKKRAMLDIRDIKALHSPSKKLKGVEAAEIDVPDVRSDSMVPKSSSHSLNWSGLDLLCDAVQLPRLEETVSPDTTTPVLIASLNQGIDTAEETAATNPAETDSLSNTENSEQVTKDIKITKSELKVQNLQDLSSFSKNVQDLSSFSKNVQDLSSFSKEELYTELGRRNSLRQCVCGTGFMDPAMYMLHRASHNTDEPHTCAQCGNAGRSWMEFWVHMYDHGK